MSKRVHSTKHKVLKPKNSQFKREQQARRFNEKNETTSKNGFNGVVYGSVLKSFMEKRSKLPNGIQSR